MVRYVSIKDGSLSLTPQEAAIRFSTFKIQMETDSFQYPASWGHYSLYNARRNPITVHHDPHNLLRRD